MSRILKYFSLPIFLFLVSHSFSLEAVYGLLQGPARSRHDSQERDFMREIYHTYSPFYTGPLLAPSANVIPKGHVNVQPYLFWTKTYGAYSRTWHQTHIPRSSVTLEPVVIAQYGMTQFMDINLNVHAFYQRKGDQQDFNYGDTSLTCGFQLLQDFLHNPLPACVVEVGMIFPTGKYQKRDLRKNGTDITGAGTYSTTFSLNFQKNFNRVFRQTLDPLNYHPFLFRWSFGYEINSNVSVEGINAYGGSPSTKGRVKPGNTFITVFAWEYSFTEQWVFATDWQYECTPKSTFSGNNGGVPVGTPASQSWSVAPAIEYNITSKMGALAGVWFSFAGRNSSQFVTGICSFTVLF